MQMISRHNMGVETVDISINSVLRFQAVKRSDFLGGWRLFNSNNVRIGGYFDSLLSIQDWIETLDEG